MPRTISLLSIAVLVMAYLVIGCTQAKPEEPNEPTVLKIGALQVEDRLPLVVAEQNGYFAEQNLKVELIPFQSAVEKDSALQSGQLDGVITDIIVAALLKDSGLDAKITTLTSGASPQEGRFAILGAPGKDFTTLNDLVGKSIGISNNTIIEYVTDGLLKEAALNPGDVNKVSIPKLPVRLEMLLSGQVDAAMLPDPLAAFAEYQGAKLLAADTSVNLSQVVLVMSGKTLQDKQAGVKGFFTAYAKAVRDINSEPEKYRALLIAEANLPEPIQNTYQMPHFPTPQLPAEQDVNQVLEWLAGKGILNNSVVYQDLIQEGLY